MVLWVTTNDTKIDPLKKLDCFKMSRPVVLHLGDDVRWNHKLYMRLEENFVIERSYSMYRSEFKTALETRRFGDFYAIYRPFWSTGGEMGVWDEEIM